MINNQYKHNIDGINDIDNIDDIDDIDDILNQN
jgi:hypothetical protein